MPDNVNISAASSTATQVATDQLSDGTQVQFVKLLNGVADSSSPVSGSTGYGLEVDGKREPIYTAGANGELQGSTSALQLPSVACRMARLVARSDNVGSVYIGFSTGLTRPDGTTDTTCGIELVAAADTGWIPVDNLNRLYRITDNAGDDLTYMTLATS